MNKITQRLLAVLWVAVSLLLISVIVHYYAETKVEIVAEPERDELVIMATYEEGSNSEYLKQIVQAYSEIEGNPEVKLQYVTQSGFQKQLCIDKDQNKLPDLIICENVMTPALQSMEILEELSDYMTAQKSSEYLKNAYSSTVVNGVSYAVPFTSDPYVMFYNEDNLTKYGMEMPERMEDFYKLCKETNTLGTYNFGIAVKNKEDITSCFLQMIYSSGGTIRNLDAPNCMQLYGMLGDMRDGDVIAQDVINWNQNDLMEAFSKGLVKIAVAELSSMSILENKDLKFNYKIAEIPYIQKQAYLLQGENIGITTTANHQEALKLLDYLTSAEVVKDYYEKTYCLSVRSDIVVNPAKEKGLSDAFVEKERNQSILKSSYSSWFVISDAIAENLADFFGDKTITPEQIGKKMQEDVRNAIMER